MKSLLSILLLLTWGLTGCGGGGGGGEPPVTTPPEKTTGPQYVALHLGDRWVYSTERDYLWVDVEEAVSVEGRPGFLLTELDLDGDEVARYHLIPQVDGLYQAPAEGASAMEQAIGRYPRMKYGLRQGEQFQQFDKTLLSSQDIDGDGRLDSAQIKSVVEVTDFDFPSTAATFTCGPCVRLHRTVTTTITGSSSGQQVTSQDQFFEAWGLGVGLVHHMGPSSTYQALRMWRVNGVSTDTQPPTTGATVPAPGPRSAAPRQVSIGISEMPAPKTLKSTDLKVVDAQGQVLPGRFSWDGYGLVFVPSAPWGDSTYTATIPASVTDALGNPLGKSVSWSFEVDAVPPTLLSTVPAPNAMDVALNQPIVLTFSEPVPFRDYNQEVFRIFGRDVNGVNVNVKYDGPVITLEPEGGQWPAAQTLFMIGGLIQDAVGNSTEIPALTFSTNQEAFQAPQTLWPEASVLSSVAGQFGGDGRLDVLALTKPSPTQPQQLQVRTQQSPTTWSSPRVIAESSALSDCEAASVHGMDINLDGRQDLVVLGNCAASVLIQGVDGSFSRLVHATAPELRLLQVAGKDGSGAPLIYASSTSGTGVQQWHITPSGEWQLRAQVAVANGVYDFAVADANADGLPDIALLNAGDYIAQTPPALEVYLQQTGGGYAAPVRLEFSQGTWLYHMVGIDLQGDRRTEWAVSQEFGSRRELVIYRLNAGQLQVRQRFATYQADLLAVGDMNQDGRPDVVAASAHTGRMEVFSNDGAGRLLAGAHSYFGAVETSSLVLADVDGDQRLDVLTGPLLNLGRAAPPLSSVRGPRAAASHTR